MKLFKDSVLLTHALAQESEHLLTDNVYENQPSASQKIMGENT